MAQPFPWTETTILPGQRLFASMTFAYDRILVHGGLDTNMSTTYRTTFSNTINADGTLNAWTTDSTPLSSGANIYSAPIFGQSQLGYYLYLFGGTTSDPFSSGAPGISVLNYGLYNGTGDITSWSTASAVRWNRAGIGAYYDGTYVYLTGGFTGSRAASANTSIYNLYTSGAPAFVVDGANMSAGRFGHTLISKGGYLYAIGGMTDGAVATNNIVYASYTAGSSIGAWSSFGNLPSQCEIRNVVVSTEPQHRSIWYIHGNTLYRGVFADKIGQPFTTIQWYSYTGFPAWGDRNATLAIYNNRFLYMCNTLNVYVADLLKLPKPAPLVQVIAGFS